MAITAIEFAVLQQAKNQGFFRERPEILELGQAEWYGDISIPLLGSAIDRHVADDARRQALRQRVEHLVAEKPAHFLFDLASVFYEAVLDPASVTTIDLHGTPSALRLDLNQPQDLQRQFDLVLNMGTAEHVFNVLQVFATIHGHTRPGGVMLHGLPFTGWVDHGFYNFHPTFYFDLAAANRYTILGMVYAELSPLKLVPVTDRDAVARLAKAGQIGTNSLLYVLLRQAEEPGPFHIPMQGYYAGQLSAEGMESWHQLR